MARLKFELNGDVFMEGKLISQIIPKIDSFGRVISFRNFFHKDFKYPFRGKMPLIEEFRLNAVKDRLKEIFNRY